MPRSATSVSKPSLFWEMNSMAWAVSAAWASSSRLASGRPMAMLSAMVPRNSSLF